MENSQKVSVLGGGSFGTAIAQVLGQNNHQVTHWMRDANTVQEIIQTRENKRYYPHYKLSENITPTIDLKLAVQDVPLIFISIPSKAFREVAKQMGAYLQGNQSLISTTKGIESETFHTMSELLNDETCCLKIGALSGPNLAGEIMENQPTGMVIASKYSEVISQVQNCMAGSFIRVYGNPDIQGVELGGALKNIYAICSGLVSSLNFGENTRSLMMTRGLTEMSRFAVKLGANPMTFIGLTGVGDMIATCSSRNSRNYQIGFLIGQGKSLQQAKKELDQTAEGIQTIKVVKKKADELNIYMPILQAMYAILYEGKTVKEVLGQLMQLQQQDDIEFMAH